MFIPRKFTIQTRGAPASFACLNKIKYAQALKPSLGAHKSQPASDC